MPEQVGAHALNVMPVDTGKGAERPVAIHLGCFLPDLTR